MIKRKGIHYLRWVRSYLQTGDSILPLFFVCHWFVVFPLYVYVRVCVCAHTGCTHVCSKETGARYQVSFSIIFCIIPLRQVLWFELGARLMASKYLSQFPISSTQCWVVTCSCVWECWVWTGFSCLYSKCCYPLTEPSIQSLLKDLSVLCKSKVINIESTLSVNSSLLLH